MPTPVAHFGAVAQCSHGGPVTFVPSAPRVLVSGQPVATPPDVALVSGCAFNVSGAPHPCLSVQWLVPALRVTTNRQALVLQASAGLSVAGDQAPQGAPLISATQTRVLGT